MFEKRSFAMKRTAVLFMDHEMQCVKLIGLKSADSLKYLLLVPAAIFHVFLEKSMKLL